MNGVSVVCVEELGVVSPNVALPPVVLTAPVPPSPEYCYDADLVAAVMFRRKYVPPMEQHKINNLLQHYMAYSGYYGADIPVQVEKAKALQQVFEEWLISKLA